jgi:hypothetical protein
MSQFDDVVGFYTRMVAALKTGKISLHSPLEEIVLKSCRDCFAYVDNRRDAKVKYSYNFWKIIKNQFKDEKESINWIKSKGITQNLLYSKSEQFPDFMFKVRKHFGKLFCGSLLELKDSKGGNIASFNSTLPTKYKSLDEIDIINNNKLVSRITSIIDRKLSSERSYRSFDRKCFYLVRTHAGKDDKVKISIVDGSFFETVPKENLIYQMPLDILNQIEKALSYVTDQTIIASSQIIEKASVRPRLRIMAEVHTEGNPHSHFYPEISERSLNLVIEASAYEDELAEMISQKITEIKTFTIHHKRNGEHAVFQFRF